MQNINNMSIRCTQCGQPATVPVRAIVDVANDPEGKALLLRNQLNAAQCPNCGFLNRVDAPLLYHDAAKSLLIAYVPMGVGVRQGKGEEKIVGDLMNQLTASIDKKDFKSYMFSPKRALTMQGVIDQVLQADGVTPEMIEAQRKRVSLAQQLLDTDDQNSMVTLIAANDDQIDNAFIELLSVVAQNLVQQGRREVIQRIGLVQEMIMQNSSLGKKLEAQQESIAEVVNDLQSLEAEDEADALAQLVLGYADNDDKVQAFVGLVHTQLDEAFFQALSMKISQAPASERDALEALRDKVIEYKQSIDDEIRESFRQMDQFIEQLMKIDDLENVLRANSRAINQDFMSILVVKLQDAQAKNDEARLNKLQEIYANAYPLMQVQLLQTMLSSEDPESLVRSNLQLIDQNFMGMLQLNMQQAQQRGQQEIFQRFLQLYEMLIPILEESMSPELKFVNDLLKLKEDAQIEEVISLNADQLDGRILELIDDISGMLQEQGQTTSLDRLSKIRNEIEKVLS